MIRIGFSAVSIGILLLAGFLGMNASSESGNLLEDPSFEAPKAKDQFGHVFAKWGGWRYEGDCEFEVGAVAHSGQSSAALACPAAGKIRIGQERDLTPGRYRITAYLRGVDIGVGLYNQTTEFMFNGKDMRLDKSGNFGWTRLTYVADVNAEAKAGPSFGLMAPGMLWIDDVVMERVGEDVPLTPEPVFAAEEKPIGPPEAPGAGVVRCPRCQRRNLPAWRKCYACGTMLETNRETVSAPAHGAGVKTITSFEQDNPFGGGTVVATHATDGSKALRLTQSYASMDRKQDWSGFDFLKVDTYVDSEQATELGIEIGDSATTGYWTRVNYNTVIPPGASTLVLPLRQLFVGEKSRAGRRVILSEITRLVFSVRGATPVYLDNLRLEWEKPPAGLFFDGLYAFDLGPGGSPVMDGFTAVTPTTIYDAGRGFGLKDAKIWRAVDALQPDPLYQDSLAIESGGLAVDVPNGTYRVFVNMDSPGGYWGEAQAYRQRSIAAQGKNVVVDTMNFKTFTKKYFNFWDKDDLPTENTFDKYDRAHFTEKILDVNVTNGQLRLEFKGQNWGCTVSAVILFPVNKAAEGERFLEWVRNKRRFYFENSFKRVLHRARGERPALSPEDNRRGYVLFARDFMHDLYYNDIPTPEMAGKPLSGDAFAGEAEPLTLAVLPLRDLGKGELTATALTGPQGVIPAAAINVGYVSYRNHRVTADGAVYDIAPLLVMPRNSVDLPQGITRQYWLTVHVPAAAKPGVYAGHVTFAPQNGAAANIPVQFTVRRGRLADTDIPAGPFGGPMAFPWLADDPETARFRGLITEKALQTLRANHFTMFSGVPYVVYQGFHGGKPSLDFTAADQQMRTVKDSGFLAVSSYGSGLMGLTTHQQDLEKMKAAGFTEYSAFLKAIHAEIEAHARGKGWPTVYWNLSDEPIGEEAVKRATENARAHRAAFPTGPPWFTGATSLHEPDPGGLYFNLAQELGIPALNLHNEASVKRLLAAGAQWAFYNQGSRWTFGEYLYKAAKEFQAQYRLAWHWSAVAGDPYYALDCREDDYGWAKAGPDGQLVLSVEFFQIAAGLTDYRYLVTLARLAKDAAGTAEARAAEQLIGRRMAAFRLGDSNRSLSPEGFRSFREEVGHAIEALSK
jgi:hypothetical protein